MEGKRGWDDQATRDMMACQSPPGACARSNISGTIRKEYSLVKWGENTWLHQCYSKAWKSPLMTSAARGAVTFCPHQEHGARTVHVTVPRAPRACSHCCASQVYSVGGNEGVGGGGSYRLGPICPSAASPPPGKVRCSRWRRNNCKLLPRSWCARSPWRTGGSFQHSFTARNAAGRMSKLSLLYI